MLYGCTVAALKLCWCRITPLRLLSRLLVALDPPFTLQGPGLLSGGQHVRDRGGLLPDSLNLAVL